MAVELSGKLEPLRWMGDSYRVFLQFPDRVKHDMGLAMMIAQFGGKAVQAKPWKGLGSGVFEVVEDFDGNAYRAVYTVRFADVVYALHAFQKKSKRGIATPRRDVDLIKLRLDAARKDHATRREGASK